MRLRPATLADHADYTRLFVELGVPDRDPTPESFAELMAPRMFILDDEGHAAGFLLWEISGELGRVRQIVVDPRYQGQGLGRRLMVAAADHLRAAGCTRWKLNVKPENHKAQALYRSLGFVPGSVAVVFRFGGALSETALPEDLRFEALGPDADPVFSEALGAPLARMTEFRAFPGTQVHGIWLDGAPAGWSATHPDLPMCRAHWATDAGRPLLLARLAAHWPDGLLRFSVGKPAEIALHKAWNVPVELEVLDMEGPLVGDGAPPPA